MIFTWCSRDHHIPASRSTINPSSTCGFHVMFTWFSRGVLKKFRPLDQQLTLERIFPPALDKSRILHYPGIFPKSPIFQKSHVFPKIPNFSKITHFFQNPQFFKNYTFFSKIPNFSKITHFFQKPKFYKSPFFAETWVFFTTLTL